MSDYHWKVRIQARAGGEDKAAEIAAKLRKGSVGLKAHKRYYELTVERTVPMQYARDALSAQMFVLNLLYEQWPEGEKLPSWTRVTTSFES